MSSLIGVDTNWLVHVSLEEAAGHLAAEAALVRILENGDRLALTPQVMYEFVHVVTDSRRFDRSLTMEEALDAVDVWWDAPESVHIFPSVESLRLGWEWMRTYRLGRKRILDTQLAALFHVHGISSILTTNRSDYSVFACFDIL